MAVVLKGFFSRIAKILGKKTKRGQNPLCPRLGQPSVLCVCVCCLCQRMHLVHVCVHVCVHLLAWLMPCESPQDGENRHHKPEMEGGSKRGRERARRTVPARSWSWKSGMLCAGLGELCYLQDGKRFSVALGYSGISIPSYAASLVARGREYSYRATIRELRTDKVRWQRNVLSWVAMTWDPFLE